MKVKELIDKLQQQDPESTVFTRYSDEIDNIYEVWSENKSWIKDKDKNVCFIGNQKHRPRVKDYINGWKIISQKMNLK